MKIKTLCEACRKKTAISFAHFKRNDSGQRWMYTCMCTSQTEDYSIDFDRFFSNAHSPVGWLVHMHEKVWMDWNEFMEMLSRFHKEEMASVWK